MANGAAGRVPIDSEQPTEVTRTGAGTIRRSSQQPATELSAGTLVDDFRVMRLIGRGGMGSVYLARDTRLGRRVALKMVQAELLGSPKAIERFYFEARVTAQFDHPHIVPIHHVGEYRGRPYVALAYVEGQNLLQRSRERRPSAQETMRFGLAIAEALEEAHRHGILHRDLKPSNVVIGSDGRVRVVDFGMAKAVQVPADAPTKDAQGSEPPARKQTPPSRQERDDGDEGPVPGGGTPAYMAPEQWLEEDCSPATDIWGLGVLLFELCTGRRPYEEETHSSKPSPWGARRPRHRLASTPRFPPS